MTADPLDAAKVALHALAAPYVTARAGAWERPLVGTKHEVRAPRWNASDPAGELATNPVRMKVSDEFAATDRLLRGMTRDLLDARTRLIDAVAAFRDAVNEDDPAIDHQPRAGAPALDLA